MSFFDFFKSKGAIPKSPTVTVQSPQKKNTNTLTVKVTGTKYQDQSIILSMGKLNSDYLLDKRSLIKKYPGGTTQYEYSFPPYKATFEFEPTNEYDPNAIKVLIQGIHVGYVKKGSCSRIRNLINQDKIIDISAQIKGGNRKDLGLYEINEKPTSTDYELEKMSGNIYIILTLTLSE